MTRPILGHLQIKCGRLGSRTTERRDNWFNLIGPRLLRAGPTILQQWRRGSARIKC